jgi:hypothetical protein
MRLPVDQASNAWFQFLEDMEQGSVMLDYILRDTTLFVALFRQAIS